MATSRSSSAAARLSRTAAAALRSSGTGYQSIRSDLAAAIVRPPPSLIAANGGKISSASFSSSLLNRIASSSALARSYSASAASGQISGAKPARKGKSALTAVVVNLPNRTLWHIYEGIEEIMADYVHHEMTRNWILISFKLFLIIVMKDLFLSLADL